jgi:quercetin dioxygenase-like cupin family protein
MHLRLSRGLPLALALTAIVALPLTAQNDEHPKVQTADTAKYGGLPILPACATFTVERGNPSTGPSLLLIKSDSGCIVPWHWHTASEELMVVSGKAKVDMKGEASQALTKGAYAFLPGKHQHQFTCQTQCLFYNNVNGAFDIHYVDKSGNEIPTAQALEAVKEKPGSSQ